MKQIDSVGGSLADFTSDHVLKVRFISQFSDIRVSLRDLNSRHIHIKSLVKFHKDNYWIKGRTNGTSAWFSFACLPPFS
jgi:hypothetical protein